MTRPAETLLVETTLAEAIERFHGGRPGNPVVDGEGALQGDCGRMELYQALRAMLPPDTAVAAFMRRAVDAASEQQPVVDAMVQLFDDLQMVQAQCWRQLQARPEVIAAYTNFHWWPQSA
jgi:hypothetical protein